MAVAEGIVGGADHRTFDDVGRRVALMVQGLRSIGVREGDCVCILMRNDIAFLEASYATMVLGA